MGTLSLDELRSLDIEISFLEGLIDKDPEYIEALQILADDYTKRGRITDGLRLDITLATLCPNDSLVHYNLACSYSLTHQFDQAAKSLTRSLRLGYRDFEWLHRDPDLEGLREHPCFLTVAQAIQAIQKQST